jgi:hypothetical protein
LRWSQLNGVEKELLLLKNDDPNFHYLKRAAMSEIDY